MHSLLRVLFFPILFLLSFLYKLLFRLDRFLKTKRRLPKAIVISVGNFSVGGTGKTPFTLHLANLLRRNFPDTPILILSRGYGSSGNGTRRVLSESSAVEIGDEPLLLKKNLPFAEVYVGRNRYESYIAYRKDQNLSEERIVFVLLDDGFQHHALHRDLDIVLVDSTTLPKRDFILPLGLLRESYSSASRADFIIISKFQEKLESAVSRWIKKYKPRQALKFYFLPESLVPIDGSKPAILPGILKGKSVFAFSGLGNPIPFWNLLNELEVSDVEILSYPDHYAYTNLDISKISEKAAGKDYIVCTEKDAVKIAPHLKQSAPDGPGYYYLKLGTKLEGESVLLKSIQELHKAN